MNHKKPLPKPTESELEVLSILWKSGPCTVRLVNDQLNNKREVGYTTTLKIMQIMHDKGMLYREVHGRTHIYKPAAEEEEIQGKLIDRLLDTAFGGSSSKLILQALGNHKSSKEELAEIKKLLKKLEDERS